MIFFIFILAFLNFFQESKWRISFIKTLFFITLFSLLYCELFSINNSISQTSCNLYWLLISIILLINIFINKKNIKYEINFLNKNIIFYLLLIISILLPLLFLCIYVPPNNYDSMSYHLPRVLHWIQDRNVYPFPTNNIRQVIMPPLSEYIILNVQLLSNSDYFVNLVQFIFYIGILILSSLIVSSKFNINLKGQFFTVMMISCVTLLLFQATTTQTDIIATFYFLSFIYFSSNLLFNNKVNFINLNFAIISIIFSFLVKYNIILFAFPYILYYIYIYSKSFNYVIYIKIFTISLLYTLLILPFLYRNNITFGNFLGPKTSFVVINENVSFINMISNFIKNISDNFATPLNFVNYKIIQIVNFLHSIINTSPDLKINNFGSYPYDIKLTFSEDTSNSILHTILLVFTFFIIVFKNNTDYKKYVIQLLLIFSSLLLYSCIFKWQPFGNRLLLPLFIYCNIISAVVLFKFFEHKNIILNTFLILFFIYSLPVLYFNPNKPFFISPKGIARSILKEPKGTLTNDLLLLIPKDKLSNLLFFYERKDDLYILKNNLNKDVRKNLFFVEKSYNFFKLEYSNIFTNSRFENYFFTRPDLLSNYKKFNLNKLPNCSSIILNLNGDGFEYPIWVKLNKNICNRLDYVNQTDLYNYNRNIINYNKYDYIISEKELKSIK